MCLKESRNKYKNQDAEFFDKADDVGNFCVNDFKIVAASSVLGDFQANGVLGFAPTDDDRSIIKQLKKEGVIEKQIISFNYENPLDMN